LACAQGYIGKSLQQFGLPEQLFTLLARLYGLAIKAICHSRAAILARARGYLGLSLQQFGLPE
jgi:hypothetical protein